MRTSALSSLVAADVAANQQCQILADLASIANARRPVRACLIRAGVVPVLPHVQGSATYDHQ